jgi:shikimate dehydrogenase
MSNTRPNPGPITLCGSLSLHPVKTGAAMHEAAYRALELPFVYVPFGMTPERLEDALVGMRALGIRGFGVSMPFKQQVIELLDELEPTARKIGAVNTIVNDDGLLTGHNTDWSGALRALEEVVGAGGLRGRRTLLVGAGGAARAVAFGLMQAGASLTITNRTRSKAERLAADVGARGVIDLGALRREVDFDVLVHATSVGMVGSDTATVVPVAALHPEMTVMDIVHDPHETQLIEDALRIGATAVHGLRTLLHQAATQFELYTGLPAPRDAMEAALAEM